MGKSEEAGLPAGSRPRPSQRSGTGPFPTGARSLDLVGDVFVSFRTLSSFIKRKATLVGLEPTTFECLRLSRSPMRYPLRHRARCSSPLRATNIKAGRRRLGAATGTSRRALSRTSGERVSPRTRVDGACAGGLRAAWTRPSAAAAGLPPPPRRLWRRKPLRAFSTPSWQEPAARGSIV